MGTEKALSHWLEMKYIEWMGVEQGIKTQREFAEFLDIDPVRLNHYFNGRRKISDPGTIDKFAEKLGPEIYDVLGLARPDEQLQELTSKWHLLDQSTKDEILSIAEIGSEYDANEEG